MTSEEITKFPGELKKSLGTSYRLLLFEPHSGPLTEHVRFRVCILKKGWGVFEANIPFEEFEAPTEYLIEKILSDLRRITDNGYSIC